MQTPPQKIDHYEILSPLGKGANGTVYRARDTKVGREVAIKVINSELAQSRAAVQRFHREAKAIARLHHMNVLQLLDYSGPSAQVPYMVTERLQGKNLDDLLAERGWPLDAVTAAAIAHEICRGLQHAHSLGIVHRDLKPENVFLEPDGRVVLCDFGIARSFDTAEEGTLASKNTRLAGSPLYMSPEQVLNPTGIGPASDMFPVGSLLFFLVTGRHAFMADTVVNALKRVINATPDDLRMVRPDLPDRFYRIVEKLFAKDPSKRYSSAQAIADSLLLLLKESGHSDPRRALVSMLQALGNTSVTAKLTAPKLPPKPAFPAEEPDEGAQTTIMSRDELLAIVQAAPRIVQPPPSQDLIQTGPGLLETAPGKPAGIETVTDFGERTREMKIHNVGKSLRSTSNQRVQPSLYFISLFGIAFIAGLAVYLSQRQHPPTPVVLPSGVIASATLRVVTQPGAEVFIDDRRVGSSSDLGPTPLAPGLHSLYVFHPELGKHEQTFEIREGEEKTLSVELKKSKR